MAFLIAIHGSHPSGGHQDQANKTTRPIGQKIIDLSEKIIYSVYDRFGINLSSEVNIL